MDKSLKIYLLAAAILAVVITGSIGFYITSPEKNDQIGKPPSNTPLGNSNPSSTRMELSTMGAVSGLSRIGFQPRDYGSIVQTVLQEAKENPRSWNNINWPMGGPIISFLDNSALNGAFDYRVANLIAGVSDNVSNGNFQVPGVAENDRVAFDGDHLLVVQYGAVYLYKVYPPNNMTLLWVKNASEILNQYVLPVKVTVEAGNYSVSSALPHVETLVGGFLYNNKIIIIGLVNYYGIDFSILAGNNSMSSFYPIMTIIVTLDINGSVERGITVPGTLVDARLTNSNLVFVTSEFTYIGGPGTVIVYLPSINFVILPPERIIMAGEPKAAYMINSFDVNTGNYNSIAIMTAPGQTNALLTDGGILYLAITNYTTPNITTEIYSILATPENITVLGKTVVDGVITSTWQLQPYKDYLLVISEPTWRGGSVNLYILWAENLSEVSELSNITVNEAVHGVRLMEDVLFLVTFRNIDPLFAVNLSDIEHPHIIGYIKSPGYDEYLHIVANNTLVGVGITEQGTIRVSLYTLEGSNITVKSRITLPSNYTPIIGYKGHLAFTYIPEYDLIIIPILENSTLKPAVVGIENGTLVFKGLLEHPGAVRAYYRDNILYTVDPGQTFPAIPGVLIITPLIKLPGPLPPIEGWEQTASMPSVIAWNLNNLTKISGTH